MLMLPPILLMLVSCKGKPSEQQTYTSGKEQILVDETFAPIIEDQTYLFESTYSDANIDLVMKSENELPTTMKTYIDFINKYLGVPVKYVSNGPGRDQIVHV